MARCVQQMSNIREWTPLRLVPALRLSWSVQLRSTIDRRYGWHSVDLALAFRSGVRALAMSESDGVGDDSAASCGPPADESGGQEFGRATYATGGAQVNFHDW